MQHPNFETRHPLQTDEQQETGFDPLHNFNKNRSRGSLDSSFSSQSQSTFLSYRKEWDDLFLNSNYLARIRQAGVNGRLRSSRFRSVCWKLYLEVLPEDKGQWIKRTKEHRAQYEKIKEMHITNPRKTAGQQDLVVNNPLSQDEGSLWNKFFQDKELKGMIKQDVFRTFPEICYFQNEDVRTKLTDILFCYGRENEQLLYKQLTSASLQSADSDFPFPPPRSDEMKCLLDPAHLEHDAYAMFSQLMETAEPWFSTFEREVRKGKEEMLTSIPFARPQDAGPSVAVVTKVNRIQDLLVKKHDIELHMHLNRLEIAPQIYGIRWVRLLFGREFPLQDLLVVWDALFADSITLDLVDYVFVAMLLYIRDALIASNFQTCLGLLMHYPPIGDINSLLQKALFLRDPKNNPRPVNYQFQQNLDYYKTRGADLMNKTRSTSTVKAAPLNINKVSSSLLSFGRKLIAPAMSGVSTSVAPINSEVYSSSSSSSYSSSSSFTPPASAPAPALSHPLAEPSAPLPQTQVQGQTQHYRLLKSESMPVHLGKDGVSGAVSQGSLPEQTLTDTQGQSSNTVSSSPSTESLSGGRGQSTASPPLPPSRGSDVSCSSPPLSATKKESFFNITRSRSHSKSMGKKETDEDLEAQVSFLQGQINDLEAMSKYCAKMMNTHICKIQEVILQEHLEKEDEVLVSLAGLKQIKDILKGALRFNQSQLEAEENEEISIADDHYTSTAAATETSLDSARYHGERLQGGDGTQSRDSYLDRGASTDERDEETATTPPEQQVASSLGSEGKNWDDYILVSQDGDLLADGREAEGKLPLPARRGRAAVRMEPEGSSGTFHDPLTTGATSGSSSPEEGSTNSKDSDFTIVNPNDL
ncbi:TBC1 domain family member 5 isoform X2 [Poecilia reticulata]|uniref:TBC1 domain family member 5 isoform X2 n=1 Tax=Poecilia reticulata TaxID=8081 RepID=UPI0004A42D94|nr:PREDICTED: TBC1 domain family member 5 isoform X2 [Poecilia reticulata]